MIALPNDFDGYSSDQPDYDDEQPQKLSPSERRRQRAKTWRDANRERLRTYLRRWKAEHSDRVRLYRQHEYLRRRLERRRLRLRREAQRRRRAIKRAETIKRYQHQPT